MNNEKIKIIIGSIISAVVIFSAVNKIISKDSTVVSDTVNQNAKPPSDTASSQSVALKSNNLDVANLTKGLNIYGATHGKSAIGLPKTVWKIKGADDLSSLEYIGSPNDGAVLSSTCIEFDKAGTSKAWAKGSPCYELTVKLFNNIVKVGGEDLAIRLMRESGADTPGESKLPNASILAGDKSRIYLGVEGGMKGFSIDNLDKKH